MKFQERILDITEQEYRDLPYISYSKLSRFMSLGFEGLSKLDDKIESPSLTFGSMVDCMITEPMEFKNRFYVGDIKEPSEKLKTIAIVIREFEENCSFNNMLEDVPDELINEVGTNFEYDLRLKPASRVTKIRESITDYYNALVKCGKRTLVSSQMFFDAKKCVDELKTSIVTSKYFGDDSNLELIYQPKFVETIEGIKFKAMFDCLYIDHENKRIGIVDLKTSMHKNECYFFENYLKYHYYIQSKLYNAILSECIKDTELSDYSINMFMFAFINANNHLAIMYVDSCSLSLDECVILDNRIPNPIDIARLLNEYIDGDYKVAYSIKEDEPNDICYLIRNFSEENRWKL